MIGDDYDAIVVGAGVLGCSAALHLARRGVKRIAIVDVVAPAHATSGAGAGFVGAWAAGYTMHGTCDGNELALENYGIEFYRDLARRSDIELRGNGSLFLARTERGWTEHVADIGGHELAPADSRELSAADVEALSRGAIATEHVYRAVWHPSGIQVDTTPTVEAMAAEVAGHGAELVIGEPATALLHDGGAVRGVSLASGDIRAGRTVVAAGAWTNDLLATVGVQLPLEREIASRVISPACGVASTLPTVMVPEMQWLWAREHRGGLTYGNLAGYAPPETQGAPPGIGQRPRFDSLLAAMRHDLTPGLAQLFPRVDMAVAEWRQGVVSHTPDSLFYVGAVPGVTRLFAVAGCNEGGVTHGPGLGRVLADLVLDGGTDFVDARRYRLDRFAYQV